MPAPNLTELERSVLRLLRARRPMSTTMLVFHLQESAGSLVYHLKGMRDAGLLTVEAKGTQARPALEWTITDAGFEAHRQAEEGDRRRSQIVRR